jgi:hypothetical protein
MLFLFFGHFTRCGWEKERDVVGRKPEQYAYDNFWQKNSEGNISSAVKFHSNCSQEIILFRLVVPCLPKQSPPTD